MNFTELFSVKPFLYFIFVLTNSCNLSCEWCTTLGNIPINPDSSHPYRRRKWEMTVEDVELFCKRFKGHGETDIHRLTGCEATVIPVQKLEKIINILDSYNRRMWMITNGFNLLNISEEHLNKIQGLILDDHGTNTNHIETCQKHLKGFYKGKIQVLRHYYHWDIEAAMKHPSNKGKSCKCIMRTPGIVNSVIYPCDNIYFIEQIRKDPKVTELLVEAGWTLSNPSIVKTLQNWRETLPPYVLRQCLYNCWRPNYRVGEKKRITLKPHDMVAAKRKANS